MRFCYFKDMAPVSSIFCNFRCDPLLVGESVRWKQATSQQLRETSSDFVRFFLCIRSQRRDPIGFERTDSKTCSGSYLQKLSLNWLFTPKKIHLVLAWVVRVKKILNLEAKQDIYRRTGNKEAQRYYQQEKRTVVCVRKQLLPLLAVALFLRKVKLNCGLTALINLTSTKSVKSSPPVLSFSFQYYLMPFILKNLSYNWGHLGLPHTRVSCLWQKTADAKSVDESKQGSD